MEILILTAHLPGRPRHGLSTLGLGELLEGLCEVALARQLGLQARLHLYVMFII